MAIDIGPVKKERPKENNIILILPILFLILSFMVYFLIAFLFVPQKNSEIQKLTLEISNLNTASVNSNIKELNTAKVFISDFKILLDNSPKMSKFFESFEAWKHPQIVYSNLKIDSSIRNVSVFGKTTTNRNLMEQIATLKNEQSIESYELSNIVVSETGETSFNISLIIKAGLLR